jgi:hypothetical protein
VKENKFWKIIESAKPKDEEVYDADYMKDALMSLPREEVESFFFIYQSYLSKLHVNNVYALGCVLSEDDLTDDGFDYFKCWLILQGKKAVTLAIDKPDNLSKHLHLVSDLYEHGLECEDFCYFIEDVYEERFGQSIYDFVNLDAIESNDEDERDSISYEEAISELPNLTKALGISIPADVKSDEIECTADEFKSSMKGWLDKMCHEDAVSTIMKLESMDEIRAHLRNARTYKNFK